MGDNLGVKVENRPVFAVGQRVRCIDAEASFNRLVKGQIYTVSGYDQGAVYVEGVRPNHSAERFEALDGNHLVAIHDRLCRERGRLANAKTAKEREFRALQVSQAERELTSELRFLGMDDMPMPEMTDDELLAALDA